MDKSKLIKMLVTLSAIVIIVGSVSRLVRGSSMSLAEYAQLNPPSSSPDSAGDAPSHSGSPDGSGRGNADNGSSNGREDSGDGFSGGRENSGDGFSGGREDSGDGPSESRGDSGTGSPESRENAGAASSEGQNPFSGGRPSTGQEPAAGDPPNGASPLTGASLNGDSQAGQRVSLAEGFYFEPLSDNLRRYITGVSYPAVSTDEEAAGLAVGYDELRYVHVLHYDFDGNAAEGELICNEYIAQDLVEIFYELYYNEYQIERMLLIDEYDGDDTASMEDNNTSCFNYRVVEGSEGLSKHAWGLAIDVNPLYNPYVTYEKNGDEKVSPAAALGYADRSLHFPYKIDEEDLCCRLFKEHGFIWGGNWNSLKDYQHFQKTPK